MRSAPVQLGMMGLKLIACSPSFSGGNFATNFFFSAQREPFSTIFQSPRRWETDAITMRVPIVKFSLLFNIIQTETLQGSSVLVLVAFDVDALAGSRLLKVRMAFIDPFVA